VPDSLSASWCSSSTLHGSSMLTFSACICNCRKGSQREQVMPRDGETNEGLIFLQAEDLPVYGLLCRRLSS
jgi:hypothetical protein